MASSRRRLCVRRVPSPPARHCARDAQAGNCGICKQSRATSECGCPRRRDCLHSGGTFGQGQAAALALGAMLRSPKIGLAASRCSRGRVTMTASRVGSLIGRDASLDMQHRTTDDAQRVPCAAGRHSAAGTTPSRNPRRRTFQRPPQLGQSRLHDRTAIPLVRQRSVRAAL